MTKLVRFQAGAPEPQTAQRVFEWLRGFKQPGKWYIVEVGDGYWAVSPFLNSELAPVEIRITPNADGYVRVSDSGETLGQMFSRGLEVESDDAAMQEVKRIAEQHGVQFDNSELYVVSSHDGVGDALRETIKAAQAISRLIDRS